MSNTIEYTVDYTSAFGSLQKELRKVELWLEKLDNVQEKFHKQQQKSFSQINKALNRVGSSLNIEIDLDVFVQMQGLFPYPVSRSDNDSFPNPDPLSNPDPAPNPDNNKSGIRIDIDGSDLENLVKTAGDQVNSLWDKAVNDVNKMGSGIGYFVNDTIDKVMNSEVVNTITNLAKKGTEVLDRILEEGFGKLFEDLINSLTSKIGALLSEALKSLNLEEQLMALLDPVRAVIEKIIEPLKQIDLNKMVSGFEGIVTEVMTFINTKKEDALKKVDEIWNKATEWIDTITQGFDRFLQFFKTLEGIYSKIEKYINTLFDVFDSEQFKLFDPKTIGELLTGFLENQLQYLGDQILLEIEQWKELSNTVREKIYGVIENLESRLDELSEIGIGLCCCCCEGGCNTYTIHVESLIGENTIYLDHAENQEQMDGFMNKLTKALQTVVEDVNYTNE